MRNYGSPRNFLRQPSGRTTGAGPSRLGAFFFRIEEAHRALAEQCSDLAKLLFHERTKPFRNAPRPVVVRVFGAGVVVINHDQHASAPLFATHTNRSLTGVNNG